MFYGEIYILLALSAPRATTARALVVFYVRLCLCLSLCAGPSPHLRPQRHSFFQFSLDVVCAGVGGGGETHRRFSFQIWQKRERKKNPLPPPIPPAHVDFNLGCVCGPFFFLPDMRSGCRELGDVFRGRFRAETYARQYLGPASKPTLYPLSLSFVIFLSGCYTFITSSSWPTYAPRRAAPYRCYPLNKT